MTLIQKNVNIYQITFYHKILMPGMLGTVASKKTENPELIVNIIQILAYSDTSNINRCTFLER